MILSTGAKVSDLRGPGGQARGCLGRGAGLSGPLLSSTGARVSDSRPWKRVAGLLGSLIFVDRGEGFSLFASWAGVPGARGARCWGPGPLILSTGPRVSHNWPPGGEARGCLDPWFCRQARGFPTFGVLEARRGAAWAEVRGCLDPSFCRQARGFPISRALEEGCRAAWALDFVDRGEGFFFRFSLPGDDERSSLDPRCEVVERRMGALAPIRSV